MEDLKQAKVIETGKTIEVYRHRDGVWVDYADCTTKYNDSELELDK